MSSTYVEEGVYSRLMRYPVYLHTTAVSQELKTTSSQTFIKLCYLANVALAKTLMDRLRVEILTLHLQHRNDKPRRLRSFIPFNLTRSRRDLFVNDSHS